MSKQKKEKKVKKRWYGDYFFIAKHVKFSWWLILLAVVANITASQFSSKIPDATAQLFDGNFEMSRLWEVVGTALLSTAITAVGTVFTIVAQAKSTLSARTSVWEYMLRAKSEYYDARDPGALLSMVTHEAETLGGGIVTLCVQVPSLATMMILALAMIFGYNADLLKVFWIIVPMHLIYLFVVGRWQKHVGKQITAQTGAMTGYLAERIRNLLMIKTFSAESKEYDNGITVSNQLQKAYKSYSWLAIVLGSYNTFSAAVSTVVTVLWGCHLLKQGVIDVPAFIGFSSYVGIFNLGFVFISIIWTFLQDFHGRSHRLAALVEAPKDPKEKKNAILDIPDGDIQVENVTFTYPVSEKPSLSGMSFTIPHGKVTAIVGPSGSGKTTFIKLLERLYDPTEGDVTVDGTNIADLSLKAWRSHLSYVVQDAGVFGGTLREALCYGSGKLLSDEELQNVIAQVGLTDFVAELPKGLDTMLGTWGGTISGGQRQRIVIARALLQDAQILIFDEPTSALDPETANAISAMILEKFRGKTVIVISHELNYISAADHIVVINQGSLEGSGEHSALMESCPVYRELMEEQSYQEVFGA